MNTLEKAQACRNYDCMVANYTQGMIQADEIDKHILGICIANKWCDECSDFHDALRSGQGGGD